VTRRAEGAKPLVQKAGLTYQLTAEDIGTTFTFSRVRRRSDALTGFMSVKTSLDVKTMSDNGILYVGSLNLIGPRVRAEFAKALTTKTPGFDIDWAELLDTFAEQVLVLEMAGEPIVEIGDMVVPRTAGAWAWEPFVPKGAPALFYGPGGSGKSRFALAGALSIQMGREILPNCPPHLKGNVLYLDWETDRDTVAERVQMICRGLGLPPVRISYRRCIRPLADDVEDLTAYVLQKNIVFLVVDSAGGAIGKQGEYGDANEGALRLFEALRIIGRPTAIVDHVSKQEMKMSGKVRGALPYGSIYKVNMARAAWEVRPIETASSDDESVHVSAFHHTKSNDSRLRPPFALRADFDEQQVAFSPYDGLLIEDDEEEGLRREVAVDPAGQIEQALRGSKMSMPDIAKYTGLKYDTVKKTLYRGKGKRFLKDEQNDLWTTATTKLTAIPGGGGGMVS
jgi:hypothetical protein